MTSAATNGCGTFKEGEGELQARYAPRLGALAAERAELARLDRELSVRLDPAIVDWEARQVALLRGQACEFGEEIAANKAAIAAIDREIDQRITAIACEGFRRAELTPKQRAAEDEARWAANFQMQHGEPWSEAWAKRHDVKMERQAVELQRQAEADARNALVSLLSVDSWAMRDIAEPDRLLGDFLTTTTRAFIVGRPGLGKTLFGLGMAAGAASGAGFLHWPSGRPAKVLYLDGEMPDELIKPRVRDAIRRLGDVKIPAGNLLIFGRDVEKEVKRLRPKSPPFAPLNTEAGRQFLFALIEALGGVDLIIFDNVMSLISGDQKDEVPWSETLPLVASLTDRRIGQVWFDHTGHNSDRQYGSSTKAWRFDAVGCMVPLTGKQVDPRATAFTLSFDHPGKARRRTPDNWRQFETQIVRLIDDKWTFEPAQKVQASEADNKAIRAAEKVKPAAEAQYSALLTVVGEASTTGAVTRTAWYTECVRQGLAQPVPAAAGWRDRDRVEKAFRARMSELKVAGWIAIDGDNVTALSGWR